MLCPPPGPPQPRGATRGGEAAGGTREGSSGAGQRPQPQRGAPEAGEEPPAEGGGARVPLSAVSGGDGGLAGRPRSPQRLAPLPACRCSRRGCGGGGGSWHCEARTSGGLFSSRLPFGPPRLRLEDPPLLLPVPPPPPPSPPPSPPSSVSSSRPHTESRAPRLWCEAKGASPPQVVPPKCSSPRFKSWKDAPKSPKLALTGVTPAWPSPHTKRKRPPRVSVLARPRCHHPKMSPQTPPVAKSQLSDDIWLPKLPPVPPANLEARLSPNLPS